MCEHAKKKKKKEEENSSNSAMQVIALLFSILKKVFLKSCLKKQNTCFYFLFGKDWLYKTFNRGLSHVASFPWGFPGPETPLQ